MASNRKINVLDVSAIEARRIGVRSQGDLTMDGANMNGGNADGAREEPNLDAASMPNVQASQTKVELATQMDGQDVNGDIKSSLKKGMEVNVKRKQFDADSNSIVESDTMLNTKGCKRKLSELDDLNSEESMEFNGFDTRDYNEVEQASHILKKLIGIGNYNVQVYLRCKLDVCHQVLSGEWKNYVLFTADHYFYRYMYCLISNRLSELIVE